MWTLFLLSCTGRDTDTDCSRARGGNDSWLRRPYFPRRHFTIYKFRQSKKWLHKEKLFITVKPLYQAADGRLLRL